MEQSQQSSGGGMSRSNIAYLVIAIIVLGIIFIIVASRSDQKLTNQAGESIEVVNLPPETVPEGFPDDVPLEEDAELVKNFSTGVSDGRVQATRAFQSNFTVDQNLNFYSQILDGGDWKILKFVDEPQVKTVIASNGKGEMVANFIQDTTFSPVTVEFNYTFSPTQ